MKTIEIDDEIYDYLLKNMKIIGESPSDILRRVLPLSQDNVIGSPEKNEFTDELGSPEFLKHSRSVVAKYIHILTIAHKQKPDKFETILTLAGNRRKYFGLSKKEIESSGASTQPKKIPGTRVWALTCLSTSQKKTILSQALKMLKYSESAIVEAVSSLDI